MTAADLAPGVELDGTLKRLFVSDDGHADLVELPAVVADCRREVRGDCLGMHVWWTVGGDTFYPLDHDLPVVGVAA